MKVVLLAEAEAELGDAAGWYEQRRAGLGDELLDEVREGLAVIVETAETWPRWPGAPARIPPIRKYILQRFPYSIAYQVYPDFIVVLGLVHAKRRPLYWILRSD